MNQIEEFNDQCIALPRRTANQLIPSLESAYYGLQIKGKYLPKISSSIITADYLLAVLFEKNYVPQTEIVEIGVILRSVKKQDIIDELLKIDVDGLSWGINDKHQPDKQWMINVLKTLKPYHPFFQIHTEEKFDVQQFTKEQLIQIKQLDLTKGKNSHVRRFFKIPKERQFELQELKKKERKQNLEKKIKRKNRQLQTVNQEIREFGERISQIQ